MDVTKYAATGFAEKKESWLRLVFRHSGSCFVWRTIPWYEIKDIFSGVKWERQRSSYHVKRMLKRE